MDPVEVIEALRSAVAGDAERGLFVGEDEWLTVPEAMAVARVSRTRLYEWMAAGLPYLDECPRQIRRSALLRFKTEKEVAVIRGKKQFADRPTDMPSAPARGRPLREVKRPRDPGTKVRRISGGTDKASLVDLLRASQAVR